VGIVILVAVGLANSVAELTRAVWLARFARASVASPLPRAFSQSGSLAGFARDITLEITKADATVERRTESTEFFADLPGPYERRVIYGSALSFAPASPLPVFNSILEYGFCHSGPLAAKLGLREPLQRIVVVGRSRTTGAERRSTVVCGPDAAAR